MGMMIKQNKSTVENAKREELLKAAQVIKKNCASATRECEGCLFLAGNCLLQDCVPEDWDIPSTPVTREEMHKFVKDHRYLRTF